MTTTLRFSDLTNLARFSSHLQSIAFEMNVNELTITCVCTKELVQEATIFYQATVVRKGQSQDGLLSDGELKAEG